MSNNVYAPNINKLKVSEIDAYLEKIESRFRNIRHGLQKKVIWHAGKVQGQTEVAIIYIHGFSASSKELDPIPERLAKSLNANLFLTRLKGHAQSGAQLGQVKDNDWLLDIEEAFKLGKLLGKELIILACSTGSPLVYWGVHHFQDVPIKAMIHVSPNFGIENIFTDICLLPYARTLVRFILGKTRKVESKIKHVGWDYEYPYTSIVPLFRLIHAVKKLPLENIAVAQLVIYSHLDKIVSVKKLLKQTRRLKNSKNKWVVINNSEDENHHVLAGNAISPTTNTVVLNEIQGFLSQL